VVSRLKDLYRKYRHRAQFLSVYISEAHALDEWPVGNGYDGRKAFYQHKSLEARIDAARQFVEDYRFPVPMVVDRMDNQFDNTFASWPVRFYILHGGKVYYKAMPKLDEYTYSFDELEERFHHLLTTIPVTSEMKEAEERMVKEEAELKLHDDAPTCGGCTRGLCAPSKHAEGDEEVPALE